ncbi:MAG: hypothetical protein LAT64_08750 [Phycisphaerales bacterium]|nr:hypothetical protein [Planctomycetota bacterium]MCH8508838.1 hypothetical protein [Phycisphaerales bacterium]
MKAVPACLLVLCLLLAPSLAADTGSGAALAEAGVRRTLAAMESAVIRADSGAYMALVDTADPFFAQEQRMWARDLRTRPVASAAFVARSTPEPHAGGFWRAPVTLSWMLPGEDRERSVSYDALFRPLGLKDGVWVYAGREWDLREGAGVRILLEPGDDRAAEMADYLADRVGELRASVETELDQQLSTDPVIKIYPDMASLQKSIALSYTDPLGGWNEPGESIKLLGRRGFVGPRLDTIVAHELGHAVSFEYGPAMIEAPWWALEGIAEIAADPFRPRARPDGAIAMAERGALMPFEALADFRGEAMNHMRAVYTQGRSMLAYLGERFGRDRRNAWLRAMAAGGTLEAATKGVLGMTFEQLDADWRAGLASEDEPDAGTP